MKLNRSFWRGILIGFGFYVGGFVAFKLIWRLLFDAQ